MEKIKKGLCKFFMVLCGGVLFSLPFLSGCFLNGNKGNEIEYEFVSVDTSNMSFYQNDQFVIDGATLTLKNKSTNQNVTINLVGTMVVSLPDMTAPGQKEIKVTYNGQTYSFNITVLSRYELLEVDDVLAEDYYQDDVFSLEDRTITLRDKKTGDQVVVALTDDMLVGEVDMTTPGQKEVMVSYNDQIYSFNINVLERTNETLRQQINALLDAFEARDIEIMSFSGSYNYSAKFLNKTAEDSDKQSIGVSRVILSLFLEGSKRQLATEVFNVLTDSIVKSTLGAGKIKNLLNATLEVSYADYLEYLLTETDLFNKEYDSFPEFLAQLLTKDYVYTFLGTELPTMITQNEGVLLDNDKLMRLCKDTLNSIKTDKSFENFEFFEGLIDLYIEGILETETAPSDLIQDVFADQDFQAALKNYGQSLDQMFVSGNFTDYYAISRDIEQATIDTYEKVIKETEYEYGFAFEAYLDNLKQATFFLDIADFSVKFMQFLQIDLEDVNTELDFFVAMLKDETFGESFEDFIARQIVKMFNLQDDQEFLSAVKEVLENIKEDESFENFDLFERFYNLKINIEDNEWMGKTLLEAYEDFFTSADKFIQDGDYVTFAKSTFNLLDVVATRELDNPETLLAPQMTALKVVSLIGYDFFDGDFGEVEGVKDLVLALLNNDENGEFYEETLAEALTSIFMNIGNAEDISALAIEVLDTVKTEQSFVNFDFFERVYDLVIADDEHMSDYEKTFFQEIFVAIDTFVQDENYFALANTIATSFETVSDALIANAEDYSNVLNYVYIARIATNFVTNFFGGTMEDFNGFERFYDEVIADYEQMSIETRAEIRNILIALDTVAKDQDIDAFLLEVQSALNEIKNIEEDSKGIAIVSDFADTGMYLKAFLEDGLSEDFEGMLESFGKAFIWATMYSISGDYDLDLQEFVYTDNQEQLEGMFEAYKTYFVGPFVESITEEDKINFELFNMRTFTTQFLDFIDNSGSEGTSLISTPLKHTIINLLDFQNENYVENLLSFDSLKDIFLVVLQETDVHQAILKISNDLYLRVGSEDCDEEEFVENCASLLTVLYDGFESESFDTLKFASAAVEFAETYLREEAKVTLYSLLAIYVVYTADDEEEIDYNELLSFIELPAGVSVDYNQMIQKIKNRTTFENAIKISNIETKVVSTQNNFLSEVVTITLDVDINVEIASFNGQFVLTLTLEK